jgi:xanthine/uracil permease
VALRWIRGNPTIRDASGAVVDNPDFGSATSLLLGLLPVLGRVMNATPLPVFGGAGIVLFGSVAAAGIRTLSKVESTNSNVLVVAASIGVGMIPITVPEVYDIPDWLHQIVESGISACAIVAVLLNLAFNHFSQPSEQEGPAAHRPSSSTGRPVAASSSAASTAPQRRPRSR